MTHLLNRFRSRQMIKLPDSFSNERALIVSRAWCRRVGPGQVKVYESTYPSHCWYLQVEDHNGQYLFGTTIASKEIGDALADEIIKFIQDWGSGREPDPEVITIEPVSVKD